jgi:hypothetical protein
MDMLFSACSADSACNFAYPNLRERFLDFLKAANKRPVLVPLKSPVDSSLIHVSLKGYQIASFINLGIAMVCKEMPKLLDRLCKADYSVLAPFIYNMFSPENYSMGMRLSVWCSEEYPFENLRSKRNRKRSRRNIQE